MMSEERKRGSPSESQKGSDAEKGLVGTKDPESGKRASAAGGSEGGQQDLKEKLQKKDDLMERLKTPPGVLSRQLLLKMEAPEAIHTPNTTAPGTMIEGEFDPPVSKSNEEYDNLATAHAAAIPGIGINDAKQQREGKENDESASDSDSDNESTDGGGGSRGGVSLPGLKVNTRQKEKKQSLDENEPLSPD